MKRHFGGRLPLQAKPDKESKVFSGFLCRVLPAFGCRHNVLLPQASTVLAWCCWGVPRALLGSSVPVPGDVPVATLRKAVWVVGRGWHRCRGGSAAGGSARPVTAGGAESRTRCCFLGGEGNVLGLVRPTQKTLCVFNEQGRVLDLHSASN